MVRYLVLWVLVVAFAATKKLFTTISSLTVQCMTGQLMRAALHPCTGWVVWPGKGFVKYMELPVTLLMSRYVEEGAEAR